MQKKILSILLVGILVVGLTGCGNNIINKTNTKDFDTGLNNNENNNDNNNNLTCSGKTSLMTDIFYGTTTSNGDHSNNDEDISIVAVEHSNEYIENGEYIFVYNNDVLTSIIGKEVFKESFSTKITDEQMKEANEKENYRVYKDRNNKIIIEYTLDKNDDLFKALRNENNLKEWLEENTNLTCNGKTYDSALDNNNSNTTGTKKDISLKCSGKVYYAYEEYNFNFKYNPLKNDYLLDNMYKNLTIPDGYDAKDYYTEEEISNMGKYEMSLNGRIITFKLDKTRAFWNDYKFKDYSYEDLKKEFSSDGYICE